MPYTHAVVDRLFVVRWDGAAEIADFRHQLAQLAEARAKVGHPLIYVPITPAGTPALASEVRKEATKMLPEVFRSCQSIHNVLEGGGFWASIMRSMFSAMVLASGMRLKVFVHSSLPSALAEIGQQLGTDAMPLERRIRASLGDRVSLVAGTG